MVYGPIHYDRDGGSIIVAVNKVNPATGLPFDNVAVTAVAFTLWDLTTTPATSLASGSAVWDSAAKTWKATIAVSAFAGKRTGLLEFVPTRAASTATALWPTTAIPLDFTDALKRQDEVEADVDALQADFNAFETVNQSEHDDSQARIDKIANRAEAAIIVPPELLVPSSGTKTYRVRFSLRDFSANPSVPADPDSDIVDLSAVDAAGGAISGLTLAGSPAGRMTRDAAGDYHVDVTVASTVVVETQVQWKASFTQGGQADFARATSRFVDVDPQLARIEAQVDAIRATDVPAIQSNIDDVDADLAVHEAARASMQAALVAEHDSTQALLTDSTSGLAALNTDLDAILASLGVDGAITIHQKLGTFTSTENLKAILGDLSTTRRLGHVLGAFTEAVNLRVAMGAFTATDNLKDVLGAYTAAASLKAFLDARLDVAVGTRESEDDAASRHTTNIAEHDTTQAAVANVDADLAAHEASRASMQTALQAEHDSTQGQLVTHDTDIKSRLTGIEGTDFASAIHSLKAANDDRAAKHTASIAEHDSTQALLAALQADVDALQASLGALDGATVQDKLGAFTAIDSLKKNIQRIQGLL